VFPPHLWIPVPAPSTAGQRARLRVMRYWLTSGVAGGSFARGDLIAAVQGDLEAAGADDVSFEIISGVVVGVGFTLEAESAEEAERLACEMLWVTSLERVGLLSVSELDAVVLV
jgi:hypothetical protein